MIEMDVNWLLRFAARLLIGKRVHVTPSEAQWWQMRQDERKVFGGTGVVIDHSGTDVTIRRDDGTSFDVSVTNVEIADE